MKKASLLAGLAGTIGGTAAWYILSNRKLRTELGKAKTPEETVKILSHYLGRDAGKISKEVHEFFQNDEVRKSLSKAKEFADQGLEKAKKGFGALLAKGKEWKDAAIEAAQRKAA